MEDTWTAGRIRRTILRFAASWGSGGDDWIEYRNGNYKRRNPSSHDGEVEVMNRRKLVKESWFTWMRVNSGTLTLEVRGCSKDERLEGVEFESRMLSTSEIDAWTSRAMVVVTWNFIPSKEWWNLWVCGLLEGWNLDLTKFRLSVEMKSDFLLWGGLCPFFSLQSLCVV